MEDDEVQAITQELNSLAVRFGITEYVFIYTSPTSYGHISGSPDGPVPSTRILGMLEAVRLVMKTRMVRAMNEADAAKKKSKKKRKES